MNDKIKIWLHFTLGKKTKLVTAMVTEEEAERLLKGGYLNTSLTPEDKEFCRNRFGFVPDYIELYED